MKKKLKLNDLSVESFVTELKIENMKKGKGGATLQNLCNNGIPTIENCLTGIYPTFDSCLC